MEYVAILCIVIFIFLYYSYTSTRKTDDKLVDIKNKLIKVDERARNIRFYAHSTESYTIHKTKIYMCLRDENGEYYPDDFLMYVALHELAHAIIPGNTEDHPPVFEMAFRGLRERATELGLLGDTIVIPKIYCGHNITS